MEITFGVRELSVRCGDDVLVIRQGHDGVAEVFLNGDSQGEIPISDE